MSTLGTMSSATPSVSSSAAAAPSTTAESAAPSSTQIAGANGTEYTVEGPILAKYESLSEKDRKDLGAPTGNEQKNPDGGVFQQFDGGVIVRKTASYVVWGKIRDKWNELGGSQASSATRPAKRWTPRRRQEVDVRARHHHLEAG